MNFKALRRLVAPSIICLAIASFVSAGPLTYWNQPGSFQDAVNYLVSQINSTQTGAAPLVTCTTTLSNANATCNGLRIDPSVSSITTATNGVVSAAVTIVDTSVAASSQVICQPIGYAGTGTPADVNVVPAAGSFTFQIQNTGVGGAAINQTVPSSCVVFN